MYAPLSVSSLLPPSRCLATVCQPPFSPIFATFPTSAIASSQQPKSMKHQEEEKEASLAWNSEQERSNASCIILELLFFVEACVLVENTELFWKRKEDLSSL